MKAEKWKTAEIQFTSQRTYRHPVRDVEMTVRFVSSSGKMIIRPAFWDGGSTFSVRVALTEEGKWQYTTACSDTMNEGLNRQTGYIDCVPYEGNLPIYQRGFLTVKPGEKWFSYQDGTPFFYLGDTHWFLCHEKWDSANVEGVDSQFRYTVDHRVSQGFTVYQSEPLYEANIPKIYDLKDGIQEEDIEGFHELDKKFEYIAAAGLVHANAQLFFTYEIDDPAYTEPYLKALARYWVARYGSYPVLWTTAQEIDPHCYGDVMPSKWYIVAESISRWDAYKQPLTAHGANNCLLTADNSTWKDKPYHSWFALQPQDNSLHDTKYMRAFYRHPKPAVCYETGYEGLWATANQTIEAGYQAFLGGLCGYGYGAQGVWNDDYSPDEWMNYGDYYRWFDALHFPGARKQIYFRCFFESIEWWKLVPRFDDSKWSDFKADEKKILASIENHVYVAFLFDETRSSGELRNAGERPYAGYWYNIENGSYERMSDLKIKQGRIALPPKPDAKDWVALIIDDNSWFSNRPLCIYSENEITTIANPGETISLRTDFPIVQWNVFPPIAKVSEGKLVGLGKNGTCVVRATDSRGRMAERRFIMLRQDSSAPCKQPLSITVKGDGGCTVLSPDRPKLQIMALFCPECCYNQNVRWSLTALDGGHTDCAIMETAGSISAVSDGTFRVTAVSEECPYIKGEGIFKAEGFGKPSLSLSADVTSSDYYTGYDRRCYPWRAVNGITDNYSGWCSHQLCSKENPVYLMINFKKVISFMQIDLYTTSLSCALQEYTIEKLKDGHWEPLCSMENNTERKNTFRFSEPVETSGLRVRCTKGDNNGNARIDQINVFPEYR